MTEQDEIDGIPFSYKNRVLREEWKFSVVQTPLPPPSPPPPPPKTTTTTRTNYKSGKFNVIRDKTF